MAARLERVAAGARDRARRRGDPRGRTHRPARAARARARLRDRRRAAARTLGRRGHPRDRPADPRAAAVRAVVRQAGDDPRRRRDRRARGPRLQLVLLRGGRTGHAAPAAVPAVEVPPGRDERAAARACSHDERLLRVDAARVAAALRQHHRESGRYRGGARPARGLGAGGGERVHRNDTRGRVRFHGRRMTAAQRVASRASQSPDAMRFAGWSSRASAGPAT